MNEFKIMDKNSIKKDLKYLNAYSASVSAFNFSWL